MVEFDISVNVPDSEVGYQVLVSQWRQRLIVAGHPREFHLLKLRGYYKL